MILKDIIAIFEKKYPVNLCYDFDNVGLIIGDEEKEIKNILLTLDVTDETIKEAISKNIDVIFSHHPVIFKKLKKIRKNHFLENKVYLAIRNDISIYSAHTNLDIANEGLNDYVSNLISINKEKVEIELDAIRIFDLDKKYSLKEIAKIIKKDLNLETIRVVDSNKKIKRIAIVTGSGDSFIEMCKENNVNLLITGDLKHHSSLDSIERGISLIDLEHFGSEKFVVDLLYKELKKIVNSNVNIIKSTSMKKVFETM